VALMGIPSIGLQMVFAHQAASSLNETHERELAGVLRKVLFGTFLIWLGIVAASIMWRQQILDWLKISNPAAVWMTVAVALPTLWFPIVMGMLQGRQNFAWYGWATIFNGIGRFGAVCVIVGVLGYYAAGAMVAVFIGLAAAIVTGLWQIRDCFKGPTAPFPWSEWLYRVGGLTLGLGTGLFMLSADMIFVRRFFSAEDSSYYAAAGMIGRALIFATQPLTAVMFPKLVQSAARAKKTDVLGLVLGLTLLLGVAAGIGCTLFPTLPLRIIYDQKYLDVAGPLVPWFVWCMVPLTLANVLISGLMAHRRFVAVPWLLAVAAGYGAALYHWHDSYITVIRILGIFGLLLFGVCALFTWVFKGGTKDAAVAPPDAGGNS
jgi:O-antigen/teichoic acid export membrane protein